jgi:hypothetical protein
MRSAGVLTAIALLSACSLESTLSETAVPGTDLKFALIEDEKHMRRYRIYLDGEEISEEDFLGAHDADAPHQPTVVGNSEVVTLEWRGSLNTQYVAFDVSACRIVQHSNQHIKPPILNRSRA